MSGRPFVCLPVRGQSIPGSTHRLSDPAAISSAIRESAYLRRTSYLGEDNRPLVDFTLRKADLLAVKAIYPPHAPAWALTPYLVWSFADRVAQDQQAPGDIRAWQVVADLPLLLTPGKWLDGAAEMILSTFKHSDAIVEFALHTPPGQIPHAHILITARHLSKGRYAAFDATRSELIMGPLKKKWLRWLRRYRPSPSA